MGIEYAVEHSDREVLQKLSRPVAEWFISKYSSFTPPQRMAIPYIKSGRNVLISSPTGTGKTLAAFLAIIDELVSLDLSDKLEDHVYAVYVSPLRALNNDMKKNLLQPLSEISSLVKEMYGRELRIRVAVRTSDTPSSEKSRMAKQPPHILITTPESLALALVAPKFRQHLKQVRWVIVDEIHELASSKRGSHLVLSLERLVNIAGEFQRIGLSATISPLEVVARFLAGYRDDGTPRDIVIVDARFAKPIDIRVVSPPLDLIYTPAQTLNEAIYSIAADLVQRHRTTLIFTNTRSATERVVFKLKKILSENGIIDADEIEAHHSSLSREVRLNVEEKLKQGSLRVVVSSTSLELGIDIGYIDLVILLSSPKSVTRLLQRVGRSGHHVNSVSKGVIVVVDRDDLVECAVLARLAMQRKIDSVKIPMKPLDILAQHIVGMSLEGVYTVDDVLKTVKRSYPYHDITEEELMQVINYLAGKMPGLEDFNVYSKIRFDEESRTIRAKRGARMIYMLNVGAIPDEAKIPVISRSPRGYRYVGDLDEPFVEILSEGDIFVLGGKTYRVLKIEPLRVVVEPAEGEKPTVPSWFSEMLPLAYDSALEVGRFRRSVADMIRSRSSSEVIKFLMDEYKLEEHAAESIYEYVKEQLEYVGLIPSDKMVLVEVWNDFTRETTNIIFHALFGRRVNDVLARAYAYVLGDMIGRNVRISVTDNGFMLTIPRMQLKRELLLKVLDSVKPWNVEEYVKKALRRTELLKKRFRHCAERSFMLLRRYRGKEVSLERRQVNAEKLLEAVESIPKFPVLEETFREILEDFMDLTHAKEVLEKIHQGDISVEIVYTEAPSPFAHSIVAFGYTDVVLMEDKRALIATLHQLVLKVLSSKAAQRVKTGSNEVTVSA